MGRYSIISSAYDANDTGRISEDEPFTQIYCVREQRYVMCKPSEDLLGTP